MSQFILLTRQASHQLLTTSSQDLLPHGSRVRVRTKYLVEFIAQRLERTRPPAQLVKCPLHQDARRVMAGEQEAAEGVTGLLENRGGQGGDVRKTQGHGATAHRLALDLAVKLLPDQVLEHGVELGRLAVDVSVHPPFGQDLGHAGREECGLALAVGNQDGALLAWALGLEILVEGDDSFGEKKRNVG